MTYGTAKEFGFDFLRDRLLLRRISEGQADFLGGMLGHGQRRRDEKPVQGDALLRPGRRGRQHPDRRGPHAADHQRPAHRRAEAGGGVLQVERRRSPTSSSRTTTTSTTTRRRRSELTREGRQKVRMLPKPAALDTVGMVNIYQYIERAIMVEREYKLDRQYVVRDGEIVIVDEFTGRLAEGRKWRDGMHQAVEAKQGVEVTVATGQAARITDPGLLPPLREAGRA